MWKCKNDIKDESDKLLFKAGKTYKEGDDRGDCEGPDEIAICLYDETGYKTYLFNGQVTNNFTEISDE